MAHALNPFDMIIFGATGDLSMRKLLPALYQAHAANLLHPEGRIIGVARSALDRAAFIDKINESSKPHIQKSFSQPLWDSFVQRIHYLPLDINNPEHFHQLRHLVAQKPNIENLVIYLSTAPRFATTICQNLAAVGLNHHESRVVLEKPLGTDLPSSQAINASIAQYFHESQIYRIDHYLGKESIQNLLPLRFGNIFFEPIWNKDFIQSVQITIAEQLGVEDRGEFYDHAGALRDMVQNHLLQMLCFVAMDAPKSLDADDVRDEKLKIVAALKPMTTADVARDVVRGQYAANATQKGYTEERNIHPDSHTETYVAIRTEIDTPRWKGVPFYLRTGKRLAQRKAEIVVDFKPNSTLFGAHANRLGIMIQPDETITLTLFVKQAGGSLETVPATMSFHLAQISNERRADAYELLLREIIDNRLNLFNRRDELECAWRWVMPILNHWQHSPEKPHAYPSGSWGPLQADELIERDGNQWHEKSSFH